jgi:hypothetical protein
MSRLIAVLSMSALIFMVSTEHNKKVMSACARFNMIKVSRGNSIKYEASQSVVVMCPHVVSVG